MHQFILLAYRLKNRLCDLLHLCIAVARIHFLHHDNTLLIDSGDKVTLFSLENIFHIFKSRVVFSLSGFQDKHHALCLHFNVQLFGSVIDIHQKQVIQ